MPEKKENRKAEELLEKFRYAFNESASHFQRMANAHESYQGYINVDSWPTKSRISFPYKWSAVEQQLAFIMDYLFPKGKGVSFWPLDDVMDAKSLAVAEDYLWYVATELMQLRKMMYLSVKDLLRYAVGYGLIDYGYVSTPSVKRVGLYRKTSLEAEKTSVAFIQREYPKYYYLHPQRVVPMPDGSDTDGPMRADHFVLLTYTEDAFRKLMDEDGRYSGDVEDIISVARNGGFDSKLNYGTIMARIAGVVHSGRLKDETPPLIPILVHYGLKEHNWIAPNKTIIRENKAPEGEILMSDVVKFSGWPDGEEWFPVGPFEASESVGTASNIFYNAMVDLTTYMVNPPRFINKSAFGDQAIPPVGPDQDIPVYGDAGKAISYAELPQFPQSLFAMGDVLKNEFGRGMGTPENLQQAIPGLVRGGSNALEMVLASSTGKQLIAAMVIKSGGYSDALNKTFIKLQEMMSDTGDSFVVPSRTPDRQRTYAKNTITMEDMAHAVRVKVKLPVAQFNSAQTKSERMALFDRAVKFRELFDIRKLFEYVGDDEDLIASLMLPEDVVEENQRRAAELQMRNMEQQAERGGLRAPAGGTSQAQQAEQGAGRTA